MAVPQLRRMLEEGQTVVAPGCYDSWSAALIEQEGFQAAYLSGGGVATALLGMPDAGLVTMTEYAQVLRRVTSAVAVPVIADAETGFGGAHVIARTVREFTRSGAAAMHIEDQASAKRCGQLGGKSLVSAEVMVERIRAAVAARAGGPLLIIARTDARTDMGLDEAISRARLYRSAGADAIFVEALESVEELASVRRAVDGPLVANMASRGRTPLLSVPELTALGYQIVLYPMTLILRVTAVLVEALRAMRANASIAELEPALMSLDEYNARRGLPQLRERERALASDLRSSLMSAKADTGRKG